MIDYSVPLNSVEFVSTLHDILLKHNIDEIVETGAFHGTGSTRVFAQTGKYVFSIECNAENVAIASNNCKGYDNVCILHALSLEKRKLIDFLMNEDFIEETTYDSKYPKTFYLREINHFVPLENALELLIYNERKQIVFLDSAGGVGFLEFLYVLGLPDFIRRNKVLIMDDVEHIKHKRSLETLEKKGLEFHKSNDGRFAYCDFITIGQRREQ